MAQSKLPVFDRKASTGALPHLGLFSSRALQAMVLAAAVSGCSFVEESLWPSLSGDRPGTTSTQIAPSAAEQYGSPTYSGPALGTGQFVPGGVTEGQPTGTYVGQQVQKMRGELSQLQGAVRTRNQQLQQIRSSAIQNSQRYHGTVAAISARLQIGTTPGNPVLVNQWNQAQGDLDRMATDVAAMNSLGNEVSADAAMSTYLLSSIKSTFSLSGAIDEDHRQLAVLEDETARTVVLVDRLLGELTSDVSRQTAYIGSERSHLTTLGTGVKQGEMLGPALGTRANLQALSTGVATSAATPASLDPRQALVVIRFDRPDVAYQQPLYSAVQRALERRPAAVFDLVAVSPAQGPQGQMAQNQNQSRRNAERVLRTLSDMGLPASRVNLTAASSNQTTTNEVHLYVR